MCFALPVDGSLGTNLELETRRDVGRQAGGQCYNGRGRARVSVVEFLEPPTSSCFEAVNMGRSVVLATATVTGVGQGRTGVGD